MQLSLRKGLRKQKKLVRVLQQMPDQEGQRLVFTCNVHWPIFHSVHCMENSSISASRMGLCISHMLTTGN